MADVSVPVLGSPVLGSPGVGAADVVDVALDPPDRLVRRELFPDPVAKLLWRQPLDSHEIVDAVRGGVAGRVRAVEHNHALAGAGKHRCGLQACRSAADDGDVGANEQFGYS